MTRVLEVSEYRAIMRLLNEGFEHEGGRFRPNRQIALALSLQASLGLRIGDVLELRVSSFRGGKLEQKEEKTGKLQYREINPAVSEAVKDYALECKLNPTDKLFTIKVRGVQKQLAIITAHMGLENIGTHSFRKMFATKVYEDNGNNIELLKELLNHTSIATTQRYIRVSQQAIDKVSASVNFMGDDDGDNGAI